MDGGPGEADTKVGGGIYRSRSGDEYNYVICEIVHLMFLCFLPLLVDVVDILGPPT